MIRIAILLAFLLLNLGCDVKDQQLENDKNNKLVLGAERTSEYLPLLKNKKVGLVVNHSSKIGETHLVDTLVALNVNITVIFSPEHGFRGTADAGEKIDNEEIDQSIRLESLYGKDGLKPSPEQLLDIDVVLFDIQEVGVRYFTFIGSMNYVMEACAENNIPFIVLDRPNPNGSYIDGPVLDTAFRSFVGIQPIPVVHGLTVGEFAKMVNGERWLKNQVVADLTVIEMKNWKHSDTYSLPIKPSPNLPNDLAVSLYPSLCLFEGTVLSVGRGTNYQFQVFGHPELSGEFSFTPKPGPGSKYPKLEGVLCKGKSYVGTEPTYQLSLNDLISTYKEFKSKNIEFFNSYFNTLAGTDVLRSQIEDGLTEEQIRESWIPKLDEYKILRSKYLLYPD